MESKTIIEVHRVLITKHQIVIDDLILMEEREDKTVTDHSSGKILEQGVTYKRQIGDQILMITEKDGNQDEATILNDEELEQFKANWDKYWKPNITKMIIQAALEEQNSKDV